MEHHLKAAADKRHYEDNSDRHDWMQLLLQHAQVSYKREQVGFASLLTKCSVLICLIYTERSSHGEQEKHAKCEKK